MEKTFEELIEELYAKNKNQIVGKTDLYNLLQQVCEAKIAECEQLMIDEDCAIYKLQQLPTDRIKITK